MGYKKAIYKLTDDELDEAMRYEKELPTYMPFEVLVDSVRSSLLGVETKIKNNSKYFYDSLDREMGKRIQIIKLGEEEAKSFIDFIGNFSKEDEEILTYYKDENNKQTKIINWYKSLWGATIHIFNKKIYGIMWNNSEQVRMSKDIPYDAYAKWRKLNECDKKC